MTVTTTAAVPAIAVDTTISGRPSKAEVLDAIVHATGCTRSEAGCALKWISDLVARARNNNYGLIYPTNREMSGITYTVFDAIMPHGQMADPGSGTAHDLVNRYALYEEMDEIGLIHDQTDAYPHYCTVRVSIGVIR